MLNTRRYTEVSLDHDLGACKECHAAACDEILTWCSHQGDGYQVLEWVEERVHSDPEFVVPTIAVHTANPAARVRMVLAVESIRRFVEAREQR